MQGRLRNEALAVEIETPCGCCGRELRVRSAWDGRALANEPLSPGAEPMVFEPRVDWTTFTEPTIVHAY